MQKTWISNSITVWPSVFAYHTSYCWRSTKVLKMRMEHHRKEWVLFDHHKGVEYIESCKMCSCNLCLFAVFHHCLNSTVSTVTMRRTGRKNALYTNWSTSQWDTFPLCSKRLFLWMQSNQPMKLSTELMLVPRLWMCGTMLPPPHMFFKHNYKFNLIFTPNKGCLYMCVVHQIVVSIHNHLNNYMEGCYLDERLLLKHYYCSM
jgi:hypothetical protein